MSASPSDKERRETEFVCQKHGVVTTPPESKGVLIGRGIDRTPHISVSCGPEKLHGHFCLICYAEWINANIPRLEEVTRQ